MAATPLVDPATVRPYYDKRGLSLDILNKCNHQEFKYIGGYGKGYWLTTSVHAPSGSTFEFSEDVLSLSLPITSVLDLEHPSYSGEHLVVVETVEPKYLLHKYTVARNYNVIDQNTIVIAGSSVSYDIKAPDATAKTLSQILTDILSGTPFSLSYSGSISEVRNVYIAGMSVFDAIERICSIYGYIWTATDNTVYIQSVDPSSIDTTYLNDIRNNDSTFHTMNIAFLKLAEDCNLEGPPQYEISNSVGSGKGSAVCTYDPYYPAFVSAGGTTVNASDISSRATTIRSNFSIIGSVIGDYAAIHKVVCPVLVPTQSLARIHGDFGNGPRSIFYSKHYPFFHIPYPVELTCGGSSGRWIQFVITALRTATSGGADAPYTGLKIATVTVLNTSCADTELIGTSVDVVDHIECVFDLTEEELVGIRGIAKEGIALSEDPLASEGDLTPCHWIADDRCCTGGEGGGTITPAYVTKTANYTLTSLDRTVDAIANSFTVTLPTAVGIAGKEYIIKNSGTGVISVATTSSQTIDGSTPSVISLTQGDSLTLQSNGSDWIVT